MIVGEIANLGFREGVGLAVVPLGIWWDYYVLGRI
jgi:hypothetical protein